MVNLGYNGEYTKEFEKKVAKICGAKYCIATNSGTAALHLGLLVHNIDCGDIITQALTFMATANVIKYVGCGPIFLDVKDNQFLDFDLVKEYVQINRDMHYLFPCKAIIPVHLNRNVGKVYKGYFPVIEDACQAFGIWKLQGDCGAVSFNWNKIISTGGGGAFLTNDKELYEKALLLTRPAHCHDRPGYNYRMPSLNAKRGLEQLETYWMKKKPRDREMQVPLTEFPMYKDYFKRPLPNTYRIYSTQKGLEFENE